MIVTTRSRSLELYNLSGEFIPVQRKRYTNYNHYKDALTYLLDILNEPTDYVVNIDEDCFVYDFEKVYSIIEVMKSTGACIAGMPDDLQHCHHRNNSPFVHNPFFNVFDTEKCKALIYADPSFIFDSVTQFRIKGCNFHEPFNCFFKVFEKHTQIDLDAENHHDGISTKLADFALHSWYSREFETTQRERIINLYNEAKYLRSIQK